MFRRTLVQRVARVADSCHPRWACAVRSALRNGHAFSATAVNAVGGAGRDYDYYRSVLKYTAEHRLHDDALQAFESMRADRVEATTHVYNLLLVSCTASTETVLKLIQEINESPVKPDLATVVTIANHYEDEQKYQDAIDYNDFLLTILKGECRDDPLRHALIAYRQLKEVNMKANSLLYSVIMHQYLDEGQLRLAYNMLMEMIRLKVKFSISTADIVMDQCIAKGFKKQANDIFRYLNAQNLLTGHIGSEAQNPEDEGPIYTMQDFESLIDSNDFYNIRSAVKAHEYPGVDGQATGDGAETFLSDSSIFGNADPEDLFGSGFDLGGDVDTGGDFQFKDLGPKGM